MINDLYQKMFGDRKKAATQDVIRLRGCYEIALLNAENSDVVAYRKIDNTVVTSGRSYVLSRLVSGVAQTDVINAIAVGTATTNPATSDTILGSEALRISISSFATSGLTNNPPSWQAQATFATSQANTTLGEAGIFNSTGATYRRCCLTLPLRPSTRPPAIRWPSATRFPTKHEGKKDWGFPCNGEGRQWAVA